MVDLSDMTVPALAVTGEELWMAYAATGDTITGRLDPSGATTQLAHFPLDPEWHLILPLEDGMTAFFSTARQSVSTGSFDAQGHFTDRVTSPLGGFFHSAIALPESRIMWNRVVHDSGVQRSVSVVGKVFPDGRHEIVSEPYLLDFWSAIVHVGGGLILFYNGETGLAATGRVTAEGAFIDLGKSFTFDPWTTIRSTGDGMVLFYNSANGLMATGRVLDDGTYIDLHTQLVGQVQFTPTTGGRYVIFRGADTLVARLDEGGVFRDTRIVRGMPLQRNVVFVR